MEEKKAHFAKQQEVIKKNVECIFGILQAHFAIISNLCHQWDLATIIDIMMACCVLHK